MTASQTEIQTTIQHSEEVHDILSEIPGWTIRWGITVVFLIVGLLLAMSWFIKYPDVVIAPVMLTSSKPPVGVVANTSGPMQIFKKEDDFVKKGQLIGLVKSSAEFSDIKLLKKSLKTQPQLHDLNENWQLGELQPFFNELIIQLKRKKNYTAVGNQNKNRKKLISRQIKEFESIQKKTKDKIRSMQRDYEYSRKLLRTRYIPLYENGDISREKYESYALEVTETYRKIESLEGEINSLNDRILTLKKEKQGVDFDQVNQTTATTNELDNAYTQLKSRLSIWEQQYLLRSPINGKLVYVDFAKDNMFLQKDSEVARVIPRGGGQVYAEMILPQTNLGKVKKGQKVFIELDQYPKREFGSIEGVVQSIAPVSREQGYKALAKLPTALKTSADKTISFKHGMLGQADVITEDIRLIHRFFYQIREAFKE